MVTPYTRLVEALDRIERRSLVVQQEVSFGTKGIRHDVTMCRTHAATLANQRDALLEAVKAIDENGDSTEMRKIARAAIAAAEGK